MASETAKLTKALAAGKVIVRARASGQVMIHFGKNGPPPIIIGRQSRILTDKHTIQDLRKSNLKLLVAKRHLIVD